MVKRRLKINRKELNYILIYLIALVFLAIVTIIIFYIFYGAEPLFAPGGETSCNDRIDNDGDGFTDCEDVACANYFNCTVFFDNFSSDKRVWTKDRGVWSIDDGIYNSSGRSDLSTIGIAGQNYSVSAMVMSSNLESAPGLIFRFYNLSEYYAFFLQSDNYVRFEFGDYRDYCDFSTCRWTALPANFPLENNKWYKISVSVKGEFASAYINDTLIVDRVNLSLMTPVSEKGYVSHGKSGVSVLFQSAPIVFFDDFKIAGSEISMRENCANNIDDDYDGFIDETDAYCAVCGDGNISENEACDDEDTESGDGCSAVCLAESGWDCIGTIGQKSVCTQQQQTNFLSCNITSELEGKKLGGGNYTLIFSYIGNPANYSLSINNSRVYLCNFTAQTISSSPISKKCSWNEKNSVNPLQNLTTGIYSAFVTIANATSNANCTKNVVALLGNCSQCGSFGVSCTSGLCTNLGDCYYSTNRSGSGACSQCSSSLDCSVYKDSSSCNLDNCNLDCAWRNSVCIYDGTTFVTNCTANWTCTNWSNASAQCGVRVCTDRNNCGVFVGKPSESKSCEGEVGICGDGNVDDEEECDDGNTESGDRCSQYCLNEESGEGNSSAFFYVLIGVLAILIIIVLFFILIQMRKIKKKSLGNFYSAKTIPKTPPSNSAQQTNANPVRTPPSGGFYVPRKV